MMDHALTIVVVLVALALVAWWALGAWRRVLLSQSLKSDEGYTSAPPLEQYLNRTARTLTVLRPGGIVEIDRRRLDARAQGEFIEKNQTVTVIGIDGAQLVVDDYQTAESDAESEAAPPEA